MGLAIGAPSWVPESKKLIVTAYAHRMARIEQLLNLVDRPGVPRKFKPRQLRYTMASRLSRKSRHWPSSLRM